MTLRLDDAVEENYDGCVQGHEILGFVDESVA